MQPKNDFQFVLTTNGTPMTSIKYKTRKRLETVLYELITENPSINSTLEHGGDIERFLSELPVNFI